MPTGIKNALNQLIERRDLDVPAMQQAVTEVMDGECSEAEIAALLTALRCKGETADEVEGAARAMISRATPIRCGRTGLLDTCGTGGDGLATFNISTATAIVAAATGVPVAKHGNRSVSSTSGSADVLEAIGVNVNLSPESVAQCIDELGIGFCFAPLVHGAMKHAVPVRKQLRFRTVFNLLGPLTNPAGADFQLVGANRPELAELLATVLARLDRQRAIVVCSEGGLDEVGLHGETTVFEVLGGDVRRTTWSAETFGLPSADLKDVTVTSPKESAEMVQAVFNGTPGPARDLVLANSAAALFAADKVDALTDGVETAAESIDSGAAAELCRRLAARTHELAAD